jgi:hypothetical protein
MIGGLLRWPSRASLIGPAVAAEREALEEGAPGRVDPVRVVEPERYMAASMTSAFARVGRVVEFILGAGAGTRRLLERVLDHTLHGTLRTQARSGSRGAGCNRASQGSRMVLGCVLPNDGRPDQRVPYSPHGRHQTRSDGAADREPDGAAGRYLVGEGRGSLHPQLVHFLERRSYPKALLFLGGESGIPAGSCGGRP